MSFRVVRNSKFRHVYGTAEKREHGYENIRVSKSSWDSHFCAVNPKFLAVIVECGGGGGFVVLPLKQTGRVSPDHPLVGGHKGPVLDIAWSPHNDNIIASGSEDCLAKVWQIPDHGLIRTLTERDAIVELTFHTRRVGIVVWHPSAQNVLLTAGGENVIAIWNVGTGEVMVSIDSHPDIIFSASWNYNGSKFVTTCRDKKIRIFDARTGTLEEEAQGHEGSKASRAVFLWNGLVFTTGFNRGSERQYSLRAPDHLHDPICMVELDTSNGILFPFYDPDTNMVYLCGKGDSVIRYFEITKEPPFVHYISTYQSTDPQRAIGMIPKRGCDIKSCEITRFYRINNSGMCQVIHMTVPRKSEIFQEDLYPSTVADTPACTAEEWLAGHEADPILMSLKGDFQATTQKESMRVTKPKPKPNALDRQPLTRSGSAEHGTSGGTVAVVDGGGDGSSMSAGEMKKLQDAFARLTAENKKMAESMRKMAEENKRIKGVMVVHENRIRQLEAKLSPSDSAGEESPPPSGANSDGQEHHVNNKEKRSSRTSEANNNEDGEEQDGGRENLAPDEV